VVTWRGRYAERGLAALKDLRRPGKPAQPPAGLRHRVLERTLTEPPIRSGATHWSLRLLASSRRIAETIASSMTAIRAGGT
jgi:Homeodomain-like domain